MMADIVQIALAAVAGLALSLFVQPLLQDKVEVFLVRVVSPLWFRSRETIAGQWLFVWAKDAAQLDRSEETTTVLYIVGRRVAGRFCWHGRTYWLLGRRETDEYISGTYLDEKSGLTFHGAFQLRILPTERNLVGRWLGYDTNHVIVGGPWQWRRPTAATYSFESNHKSGT